MRIAFRTDASVGIGTGHVMRCLTLAQALRDAGADCVFLCRDLDGHLLDRIDAAGFGTRVLPRPEAAQAADTPCPEPAEAAGIPARPATPAHAAWAEVTAERDAAETRTHLKAFAPDWVVLDHYAFDAEWQRAALPAGTRLMVIDDLADRPHLADVLLDQNLGREARDYDGLVPAGCRLLIGPRHALLRPEFAQLRPAALAARKGRPLRHILVSMGGVDFLDVTSQVLDALAVADLPDRTRITVVMGGQAPALERVRARAAAMPLPCEVRVDVTEMATLMADADLAVGAVGGTTWERCCLGLPSVIIPIAENQQPAARAMAAAGGAILVEPGCPELLAGILSGAAMAESLRTISGRAAQICDGGGLARISSVLLQQKLYLRRAGIDDAKRVFDWRHAGDAARYYRNATVPEWGDHLAWFERALEDETRMLLILSDADGPVSHIRLDLTEDRERRAEIGICIDPARRGSGIGIRSLLRAKHEAAHLGLVQLNASIHRDNAVSIRLFESAGFVCRRQEGDFLLYRTGPISLLPAIFNGELS